MPYIDVGKLLKELTISPDGTKIPDVDCDNVPVKIDLRLLRRIILRQPTADVEEVKHGYWVDIYEKFTTVAGVKMGGVYSYKCSLCGRRENNKEPYCNCGAKMDGGNAE